MPDRFVLADAAAKAVVSPARVLADSFRRYERLDVEIATSDGRLRTQHRDVLRVGRVIGVLPLDLARGEVVLLRQFRLAAHLATGQGELVEIVAGHVEHGEELSVAARRECQEEIGVVPSALYELFSFLPAPGHIEEFTTLYLGLVDAAAVPARAGAAHEGEETRPMRVPVAEALKALPQDRMHNGYLILALQWLTLNWPRIDDVLRSRKPV